MLKTPLGRFRTIVFIEGLSFLILLLIAMPLKYVWGMPMAVRVVGMAHGVLFIAFLFALMVTATEYRWGPRWIAVAIAASLVPGGTFWLDAKLRREEARTLSPST